MAHFNLQKAFYTPGGTVNSYRPKDKISVMTLFSVPKYQ
jgi:hypothetical protein